MLGEVLIQFRGLDRLIGIIVECLERGTGIDHLGKHAIRVLIELQHLINEAKNNDKKDNSRNNTNNTNYTSKEENLSLSSNFIEDLENGEFYDVEFIFEDGTPSFKAHKLILAKR